MALGDYILCCKCEVKLIYDGDRNQREWWEERFGKPPEIECPDCKTPQRQPEQEPVATVMPVATVISETGDESVTMSWWHEPALPIGTQLYTTSPQRQPEQEPRNIRERWNIERDGDDLLVCFNEHEKSEGCRYERYVLADKSPPQRQPLTDEEIRKAKHHMVEGAYHYSFQQGVRYAEAAHDIKGEA
jgi:hypothetical protein